MTGTTRWRVFLYGPGVYCRRSVVFSTSSIMLVLTTRSATEEKILSLGPPAPCFVQDRPRLLIRPTCQQEAWELPCRATHRIVAPCTEAPVLEVWPVGGVCSGNHLHVPCRSTYGSHRRNKGFSVSNKL